MRNDFMKRGEEAFAVSAKVNSILKEAGFRRSGSTSVFVNKEQDVRIVRHPSSRNGSIVDYGYVERQILDGDDWVTKNVMCAYDFAHADKPMEALEAEDEVMRTSTAPKPSKPPKPTPLW